MKERRFKPTGALQLNNFGGMEVMIVEDEDVYYRMFGGKIRHTKLYWKLDEDEGSYEPMFWAANEEWKLNEFMLIGGLR